MAICSRILPRNSCMNKNKICFIMCTNDLKYEKECRICINHLYVPENMDIEVLCVKNADSMASGYDRAMVESDAKYKIYLHQDVLLVRNDLITLLLDIFKDESIGMIGFAGNKVLTEEGYPWCEPNKRIGMIYCDRIVDEICFEMGQVAKPYEEVVAVDGLFMATQYDIRWRCDIFKGWDFYDLSQSMEFRKAGYKVVVPSLDSPYCLHDNDMNNLSQYSKWKKIFWEEYGVNIEVNNGICLYQRD